MSDAARRRAVSEGPELAEHEVDEAIEQLNQLDEQLHTIDSDLVSGPSPTAAENRAIRGAAAKLARQHAREVRAALARISERQQQAMAAAHAAQRRISQHAADAAPREGAALARALDHSARAMTHHYDGLDDALALIVTSALDAIPGADHVGINLALPDDSIESRAPSDDVVRDLDQLQSDLHEGPCIDAIWTHERTLVLEMSAHQTVWPRFAPAAVQRGVHSLVSFQLFKHGTSAALNVYADTADAFTDHSLDIAALFAAQAALVLQGAERVEGLENTLLTRDTIGQAKGILMERFGIDDHEAFARLVSCSKQTNIKLRDVARSLITDTMARRHRSP